MINNRVNVVSPNGDEYSVPRDKFQQMLNLGWRGQTEEEKKRERIQEEFGDRKGSAALAGAARGLTFGLADVALTKSGLVNPETLSNLRTANPGASDFGETAAIIGSSILPTGPIGAGVKGASKLGSIVASRLGRGIAKEALEGATQGALYGAGKALTESALNDQEMTAESILANMAEGTLLGGGFGAALDVASAAKPYVGAFARNTAQKIIKSMGDAGVKVSEVAQKVATGKKASEEATNVLKDFATQEGMSIREKIADLPEKREEIVKRIQSNINSAVKSTEALSKEANKNIRPIEMQKLLQDVPVEGASVAAQAVLDDALAKIKQMREEPDVYKATGLLRKLELQIQGKKAAAEETAEGLTDKSGILNRIQARTVNGGTGGDIFDEMQELKRRIGDDLSPYLGEKGEKADTIDAVRGIYDNIKTHLEDAEVYGAAGERQRQLNATISNQIDIEKRFLDSFGTLRRVKGYAKKQKVFDPTKLNTYINKIGQSRNEYQEQVLADYLNHTDKYVSELETTFNVNPETIAKYTGKKVQSNLKDARSGIEEAKENLSQIAMLRATDPGFAFLNYMDAGGLSGLSSKLNKIPGAGIVSKLAETMQSDIMSRAKNQLKAEKFLLKSQEIGAAGADYLSGKAGQLYKKLEIPAVTSIMNDEQTKKTINQVNEISKNPEKMQSIISAIDDPIAGAKYASGIQYLASQLPEHIKTMNPNSISPLREMDSNNKKLSKSEINRFRNAYMGFNDPLGTMQKAIQGQVTPEAIEAVKATYPRLYSQIVKRILEDIADKDLPYRSKINLAALTGSVLDDSMTAQGMASIQGSYGIAQPDKQSARPRATPMDFPVAHMTQSQRIQEKRR